MANKFAKSIGGITHMELAWNTQKNYIKDVKGKEMEQERKGKISNKDIDSDRTKNNMELVDSDKNLYQRVKDRVDDLKANGSRVQKNSVVMYSNILTVPEEQAKIWGEQKTDDYFKACYEFFCEEFGKENVVSAKIHKDETTPHMHLHFVPVNKENGKLQARVSMNKVKINYIHDELPKFLRDRGFDVQRATGKTKENNIEDIHEFKEVKKQITEKEIELQQLDEKIELKQKLLEKIPTGTFNIKAEKEFKIEKVKTGLFGTEEKKVATGNFVVSPAELKKVMEIGTAALEVKDDYKRLLATDLVRENKKLNAENSEFANTIGELVDENEKLSLENRNLKAHISDLKAEIGEIYKFTKDFLKARTSDLKTFKSVFKEFVGKVKEKVSAGEFERLEKREQARERNKDLGR